MQHSPSEWQRRERTGTCHGLVTSLSRHPPVIERRNNKEGATTTHCCRHQPLPSPPCPLLSALAHLDVCLPARDVVALFVLILGLPFYHPPCDMATSSVIPAVTQPWYHKGWHLQLLLCHCDMAIIFQHSSEKKKMMNNNYNKTKTTSIAGEEN